MIVEALVIIGFDPDSEKVIENLKKASDILRKKYGIKLVIIPYNTWNDLLTSTLKSLPSVYIGGRPAFIGRVPLVEEVVDFVINIAKERYRREETYIPAALHSNEPLLAAAQIEV